VGEGGRKLRGAASEIRRTAAEKHLAARYLGRSELFAGQLPP